MGSPFFGLDIALTGLYTSQIQLNTATHNVSNVETEGYTRQSVTTKAADAMETSAKTKRSFSFLAILLQQSCILHTLCFVFDMLHWYADFCKW